MFKHYKSHCCLLVLFLLPALSNACTLVFWNNNPIAPVAARSTDLFISDNPKIMVLPRGMARDGMVPNALKWRSKYGSVVVTAFNTPTVSDGMNEKGLAAHLLYLSGTEYPKRDATKPAISNLLWAQYVLDNYQTVPEVLADANTLQIIATQVANKMWPIHLAVQDANGDSAIIEYTQGKLHVYHSPEYRVMTNEPAYPIQLANLKKYQGFGGKLPLPGDSDPLSRFVRVSTYLKTLPVPKDTLEALAGILSVIRTAMVPFGAVDTSGSETEDAWPTRWISLVDQKNKIYYFSSTSAPNIIWLDFQNLNFSENAKALMIDPTNIHLIGEISKNLKIVSKK